MIGSRRVRSSSRSPRPRSGQPASPRKKDPERKRCLKGWKRMYSTGSKTRGRVCPHTRMTQGVNRTIAVAGIQNSCSKGIELASEKRYNKRALANMTKALSESEGSTGGHWNYDDLKEAFVAKFRQQKKCINDLVEIHHNKQKERESAEDFIRRFKVESMDVKGAPEIMRISGFMHGNRDPELIKRLHDKIPKLVDEMMRITISFLRGRWQLVTKNERSHFCHGNSKRLDISRVLKKEVRHNTGECMHLKRQIEELLKTGKLSYVIKELKQNNRNDQPKENKNGETSNKDKVLAILMPADMTGVPKHVAKHRLNIREGCPPVRQKRISEAADRNQEIQEEVEKLVNAGIMKEVHYHGWLSNPGFAVALAVVITEASQSRQHGKSKPNHMVLCSSRRVEEEMFLGYNINTKRIKVCPDKVDAVLSLPSPKCLKDVQQLKGKRASLNRFLAKSAERIKNSKRNGCKEPPGNLDSRLVANQVNRTHIVKEADMIRYPEKVRTLTNGFRMFSIKQVPRSEKKSDALSKIASTSFAYLSKQVLVEELKEKSINELEVLAVLWITLIYEYLTEETLPSEVNKARVVRLIPAEIGMPTLRTAEVDMVKNNEALGINLDLLEERREQAAFREAKSIAKIEKYYNSKVRSTSFKPGDLVYRSNDAIRMEEVGKLGPKWEGLYEITEALGIELLEAKVVDKVVVVAIIVGMLSEVPDSPTKFSTDNESTKGVQTPIRADRFAATFSLILSTLEWVHLVKMTKMFHPGPLGLQFDEHEASIDQHLAASHSFLEHQQVDLPVKGGS
nr:reverse transcriptase domain-containing protein [Tanacetum cinerariifolium]